MLLILIFAIALICLLICEFIKSNYKWNGFIVLFKNEKRQYCAYFPFEITRDDIRAMFDYSAQDTFDEYLHFLANTIPQDFTFEEFGERLLNGNETAFKLREVEGYELSDLVGNYVDVANRLSDYMRGCIGESHFKHICAINKFFEILYVPRKWKKDVYKVIVHKELFNPTFKTAIIWCKNEKVKCYVFEKKK